MSKSKGRKRVVRRRYLKMFSQAYINTGPTPNSQVLAGYSERARSMPDPYLDSLFPGIKQNGIGRKEALARKVSIMLEDVQKDNYVVVLQVQNRAVLLYYNSNKTKWFFVRKTDTEVQVSLTYPSKLNAERAWNDGHVVFPIRDETS